MTILVTGGDGIIGGNFVLDWVAQTEETVVNLVNFKYASLQQVQQKSATVNQLHNLLNFYDFSLANGNAVHQGFYLGKAQGVALKLGLIPDIAIQVALKSKQGSTRRVLGQI